MTDKGFWIYLLILCCSTYLIRAIPFAAVNKRISNVYVRSFLYYIPYTVLSAMTFPAAIYATGKVASASVGLAVGMLFALWNKGLTTVAIASCLSVYAVDIIINNVF